MLTIIKNAEVYAPDYLGRKDVLFAGGAVLDISDRIELNGAGVSISTIDGSGKRLVPGFVDNHVHILGGGGEGGYKTRTPELVLSTMIESGVTTVVGCLGTDGVTRSMKSLVAKAKGLKDEGVSCYIYTGSYDVPVRTLMGSIREDIILVEEIIGVGEVAVSDHRSSQPTKEEIAKLTADARVAGMLSGKAGVVNVHLGDGADKLDMIEDIVATTTIPITHFIPTHINRSRELYEAGIAFAKKGGYVDFTISPTPDALDEGEVKCSAGLKEMLDKGVACDRITFSSDGQGSLPLFNAAGELTGLGVGKMNCLLTEVVDAHKLEGVPFETALKCITSNPTSQLKLHKKGRIAKGMDADLVLLDAESFKIDTVVARGRVMMANQKIIVKGTFE